MPFEQKQAAEREKRIKLISNKRAPHYHLACPQVERHDGEVAAPGGRPMAFEEKRRLSQGLGSLAGDKLGVVMEIIAESQHFDSVRLSAILSNHPCCQGMSLLYSILHSTARVLNTSHPCI